jgi:hypothetical protein
MAKKEKSGSKKKKGKVIFIAFVLLLLGAAGYIGYDHFFGSGLYKEVSHVGDVLTNGEVQIVFNEAEVFTEIDSVALDPDYVYVKLYYQVTNLTENALTWRRYPYVSVNAYKEAGGGYRQMRDTECEYDFTALQVYAANCEIDFSTIINGLAPAETRKDADIVKIPKEAFETTPYFVTIDNIHAIIQINDPKSDPDAQAGTAGE